jgi:DNA-binding response OmpR family regulator
MAVHTAEHPRRPVFSTGAARWPYRVVAVDAASGPAAVPAETLTDAGIELATFRDGASALLRMSAEDPAAILAPTEMLGVDFGYFIDSVLELSAVPVIVGLTGQPGSQHRAYQALDKGARALIALPAEREQLSALTQQFAGRRSSFAVPLTYRQFRMDPAAHRVEVDGHPVNLSPIEFAAMALMLERAPSLVPQEHFREVLSGDRPMTVGHLKRVISRLRARLASVAPDQPDFIETVRSCGYRLRS